MCGKRQDLRNLNYWLSLLEPSWFYGFKKPCMWGIARQCRLESQTCRHHCGHFSQFHNMHAMGKTWVHKSKSYESYWALNTPLLLVAIKVSSFHLKYKCEGISCLVSIGHEKQLYVMLEREIREAAFVIIYIRHKHFLYIWFGQTHHLVSNPWNPYECLFLTIPKKMKKK